MKTFGASELERLLPLRELRERMKDVLVQHAASRSTSSPRHVLPLERGAVGAMLGVHDGYSGGKLVAVLPGNRALGLNPHQGVAALFDPETGVPLAVADASMLTALRTAAVSAAATDALARPGARILGVAGAGEQAFRHIQALLPLRDFRELKIYARDPESAIALASRFPEMKATVVASPREAARADVLCLCTSAKAPYLAAMDLRPGTHVNAVGACRPGAREIDLSEGGSLRILVDSNAAAREEAEELRVLYARGEKVEEVGRVFAGNSAGRTSESGITFFKSVGLGAEDTAALALAFERSEE